MKSTGTVAPGPAAASALHSSARRAASSGPRGAPAAVAHRAKPPSSWTSSEQPTPRAPRVGCRGRRRGRGARSRRRARDRRPAAGARAAAGGDRGAVDDPGRGDARREREARAGVAAHRARVGVRQDDLRRARPRRGRASRRAARGPMPRPWSVRPHDEAARGPRRPRARARARRPTISPAVAPRPRRRRDRCAAGGAIRSARAWPAPSRSAHCGGTARAARDPAVSSAAGRPRRHRADQHGVSNQSRPRASTAQTRTPTRIGYPSASPMAVPKQKQSHTRTHKRRSQHKISRADVQRVPAVPQPAPSAPRLPRVRLLRRAARSSRPPSHATTITTTSHGRRAVPAVTVAVDANGADLGPGRGRRRRGRSPRRRASRPAVRPGRRDRRRGRRASRSSTRRCRSPRRADPRPRRASTPDASIVRRRAPSPTARPTRSSAGGSTGRGARRGPVQHQARPRHLPPALAIPLPVPGHPVTLLDVGANAEVRPEHLVQFALHGRGAGAGRARHRAPARRPAVQRRGGDQGHAARARGPRALLDRARRGLRASTSSATSRARRSPTAPPTSIVTDGFTGNVTLKLIEGVSQTMLARGPRRGDVARAREARRRCCCARRCARCATSIDPEGAGRRLPARAAPARRRAPRALHALRHRPGDPAGRARRRASDVVGRTHAALEAAGALRAAPAVRPRPLRFEPP